MAEKKVIEKRPKETTPVGIVKWAHIHKAKPPHQGRQGGAPMYRIDLVFTDDDKAWKAWADAVMERWNKLPIQYTTPARGSREKPQPIQKQPPVKAETDNTGTATGRWYVTFKTGEAYPPEVYDVYGRVIPKTIGIANESKAQVSYVESVYEGFGGGINFYLNAIFVVDLIPWAGGHGTPQAHGFKVQPLPPNAPGYTQAAPQGGRDEGFMPPHDGGYGEEPPEQNSRNRW